MHIPTHLLSGWCLGNLLGLDKRGRFLAIIAGSLADLDGLGIFISLDCYKQYHHVICHNLLFGLLMSAGLALFVKQKKRTFATFFIIFHVHLLMDSFGSGHGWTITYLWPFSRQAFENPCAWSWSSWQNTAAGIVFALWAIGLIFHPKRTFLEYVMPKLDRQGVAVAERLKLKILETIKITTDEES